MDFIEQIINTTISSFDFTYCIIVNLLTYFTIKIIDDLNGDKKVSTWTKRGITVWAILFVGVVYYLIGIDTKLLFNSAILAPVFWSWIGKPIAKKLDVDYKQDKD